MPTEKEKMLSGKAYKAFGKELMDERQQAKELLFDFNTLRPSAIEARNEILGKLLGKTGQNFYFEPPFRCDYGYNIEIGDHFYANYNFVVLDCAKVSIGSHAFIGPNVSLFTAGHPIHQELRDQEYEYALPITIGNSVWLGGNVVVNAGITIGDNVVIGSGSVVTKDIPSNVLAVGNPCKVIRELTEEDKQYYYKKQRIG
ncbi:MAG: lacA1 [Cytophagaceae bacterium]|jgi:maltose O-acetyltransferase|nr:lacA1 [Cytophagaceae bacterium]